MPVCVREYLVYLENELNKYKREFEHQKDRNRSLVAHIVTLEKR